MSSGLTTVPEGHKLGKASSLNPHPEVYLLQTASTAASMSDGHGSRRSSTEGKDGAIDLFAFRCT